ncbi:MAG: AsmA-like C-terminal region-containing protein [Verrucomicrobiota bacterium]
MFSLHFRRNLRTFAFLAITFAVLTSIGLLWWANHTGLPASWRAAIEKAIEEKGAHVRIGALRFDPLRGLIADGVRVFSDESKSREIATLDRVVFDFDKRKLARGKVIVTRVELRNGSVSLHVDPEDRSSDQLSAKRLNGTLLMPGNRRFELRDASGTVAGIRVNLDGQLVGWRQGKPTPPDPEAAKRRRMLIARIINDLELWQFDPEQPPQLTVRLEGNLNDDSATKVRMLLDAANVGKNGHVLSRVKAAAELNGDLLTVTEFLATDQRGEMKGRADYDLSARDGRFDFRSSLDIPRLLRAWAGVRKLPLPAMHGKQQLVTEGDFLLHENGSINISATGRAICNQIEFRGTRFEQFSCAFAWKNNGLLMRDMVITHKTGEATGKIMWSPPEMRVAFSSNMAPQTYLPFVRGQPLEMVINDFSPRNDAECRVNLEGFFDVENHQRWTIAGDARIERMSFRDVPLNHAECLFDLNHEHLDFFNGSLEFDYTDDPLRKAYGGPSKGGATVGRIRYNHPRRIVEVENVTGTMWPVPLVRTFAAQIAPQLEPYRFHTPPRISGNGVVDVTPRNRTNLTIAFSSESPADYRLFEKNITLGSPSGKVRINGDNVTVDDLSVRAFQGTAAGTITHSRGVLRTDMHWSGLSVTEIAKAYDLQMKSDGELTGRVDCTSTDGKIRTLNGNGLLALEKAELFSVPMFGPLSRLVRTALNSERAGYERAKSAFFTFTIRDGVVSTADFRTSTRSLAFAGDGHIDLADMTFDMTLRMNARGLLGLITLPLRPFYGMFQFRGRGPLKNPGWEHVMFTKPPKKQDELLSQPLRARVIDEPPPPPPRAVPVD